MMTRLEKCDLNSSILFGTEAGCLGIKDRMAALETNQG